MRVPIEDAERPRRRQSDGGRGWANDIAKILIPILISAGVASYLARGEASEQVAKEVAVIKATEANHFDELQRSLRRIEEWMARQEKR